MKRPQCGSDIMTTSEGPMHGFWQNLMHSKRVDGIPCLELDNARSHASKNMFPMFHENVSRKPPTPSNSFQKRQLLSRWDDSCEIQEQHHQQVEHYPSPPTAVEGCLGHSIVSPTSVTCIDDKRVYPPKRRHSLVRSTSTAAPTMPSSSGVRSTTISPDRRKRSRGSCKKRTTRKSMREAFSVSLPLADGPDKEAEDIDVSI